MIFKETLLTVNEAQKQGCHGQLYRLHDAQTQVTAWSRALPETDIADSHYLRKLPLQRNQPDQYGELG
jgi:hypothetical protein